MNWSHQKLAHREPRERARVPGLAIGIRPGQLGWQLL